MEVLIVGPNDPQPAPSDPASSDFRSGQLAELGKNGRRCQELAANGPKAYDADVAGDASAWAALPLRYGPYCSTWVLLEHPQAPAKPASD
jgi:hypothetical protein